MNKTGVMVLWLALSACGSDDSAPDAVVANAPARADSFFQVPKVVD